MLELRYHNNGAVLRMTSDVVALWRIEECLILKTSIRSSASDNCANFSPSSNLCDEAQTRPNLGQDEASGMIIVSSPTQIQSESSQTTLRFFNGSFVQFKTDSEISMVIPRVAEDKMTFHFQVFDH